MVKSLYDISEFEVIDFFGMKIHHIHLDNTTMFHISDLIDQYNKLYFTKKSIKKYLSTYNVIEFLEAEYENNKDCIEDKTKIIHCGRLRIPGYIHFIMYTDGSRSSANLQGYLVCEQLLYDILTWVDKSFKWSLFTFLKDIKLGTSKNMTEVVDNLQKMINDREYEILTLNNKLDTKYEERNKMLKNIEDITTKSTIEKEELTSRITTLENKINSQQQEINKLQLDVNSLKRFILVNVKNITDNDFNIDLHVCKYPRHKIDTDNCIVKLTSNFNTNLKHEIYNKLMNDLSDKYTCKSKLKDNKLQINTKFSKQELLNDIKNIIGTQ